MSYRIVKRPNALHKDKVDFVLQTDDLNRGCYQNGIGAWGQNLPHTQWSIVEVFATLEAAQNKKHYLTTGLNPGEEIVG